EVDDPPAGVRNLDAHGLLSGDRRQDADVGGGEGVGEVVLELRHLPHLDSGSEAQLVSSDVRPGDAPYHLGLDPKVAERLEQGLCYLLLSLRIWLGRLAHGAGQE